MNYIPFKIYCFFTQYLIFKFSIHINYFVNQLTTQSKTESIHHKTIDIAKTKAATTAVVLTVSSRVGHTTLRNSILASLINAQIFLPLVVRIPNPNKPQTKTIPKVTRNDHANSLK